MEKTLTPGEVLALYPPHADTIPTLLASRASALADKVALEFESRHWTYAALDEVSTLLAQAAVQRGVNKGDRIAVVSVNTDLSIIAFLAAAKAGAIFVPLNPAATDEDLHYMLSHSGASVVVSQPEQVERVRTVVERIDEAVNSACAKDASTSEEARAAAGCVPRHDARDRHERARARDGRHGGDARIRAQAAVARRDEVSLPDIGRDDPVVVIYTSGTTWLPEGRRTQPQQLCAGGRGVSSRGCICSRRSDASRCCRSITSTRCSIRSVGRWRAVER